MGNLSFKIDDNLHRGLRMCAAMDGRKIADIIQGLIREWVRENQDPLLRVFATAPQDDEPLTDEDRIAIKAGEEDIRAGNTRPIEEIEKDLG